MYAIILNPVSGKNRAYEKLEQIEELLKEKGIEYRIDTTHGPGDAVLLAEKAVEDGLDGIIAMGGDGTFSEVANGIGESGIELLFAPCGTGNDFMRMFNLPKDAVEAIKIQLDAPIRMIDMGRCNDRYFLNVTGCGFDVDVLLEAGKYKGNTSSIGAYMRGAYAAIKKYKPMDITVSIDDGPAKTLKSTVLSVGNGRFIGGGMKAVPSACVEDGLFDLMIVGQVNRFSIYFLLLLFAAGKHTMIKRLVNTYKCHKVRIQSNGMHLEADGEIFACDDACLTVIPGALRTRLPV